jgi:hypothetical protein
MGDDLPQRLMLSLNILLKMDGKHIPVFLDFLNNIFPQKNGVS